MRRPYYFASHLLLVPPEIFASSIMRVYQFAKLEEANILATNTIINGYNKAEMVELNESLDELLFWISANPITKSKVPRDVQIHKEKLR